MQRYHDKGRQPCGSSTDRHPLGLDPFFWPRQLFVLGVALDHRQCYTSNTRVVMSLETSYLSLGLTIFLSSDA